MLIVEMERLVGMAGNKNAIALPVFYDLNQGE
jgi:hypothetical protein